MNLSELLLQIIDGPRPQEIRNILQDPGVNEFLAKIILTLDYGEAEKVNAAFSVGVALGMKLKEKEK